MEENTAQKETQKQEQNAEERKPAQPDQKEDILKELEPNFLQRIAANKFTPPVLTLLLMTALFVLSLYIATRNQRAVPPEEFQREPIPTAAVKLEKTKQEEEGGEGIDTSDWETYENEEYGFTFKYPDSAEVRVGNNTFTNDLVEINGLDSLVIRIEPTATDEASPEGWWSDQETEPYTGKPISCFSQQTTSTIKSLYNPEETVLDLDKDVLIGNNFFSEEENCLEPPEVQIILVQHRGNIIKITYDWARLSEQILSTLQFTDESVQGATTTSCLEQNTEILAEIQTCEEISEARCVLLKADYDECMSSCQENLSEEACIDVCRPVCQSAQ